MNPDRDGPALLLALWVGSLIVTAGILWVIPSRAELKTIDVDKWPLHSDQRFVGDFSVFDSSIRSSARFIRLPSNDDSRYQSDATQSTRQPYGPPTGRRFVLFGCFVLLGLFCSIWGWFHLDYERLPFSSTWIWIGGLFYAAGFFLWWATFAFPSTWGWWL